MNFRNNNYFIIILIFFGIILYLIYLFVGFPEYFILTKYSSLRLKLKLSETELWQKQNNLNLKYINLTKLENWRRNNSTKFLLIEITRDHWGGWCGGLANQIWTLSVIYVWGLQTGRYPGYFNNSAFSCDAFKNSPSEMEETFPVAHRIIVLLKPDEVKGNTKFLNTENITEMIKTKEKYLRIYYPPQNHKIFKNITNQIKELFLFSNKIRIIVDKYINEIFSGDSSFKLCIHTRLGDFRPPRHPRSRKDFTEESTKFVFNEIKSQLENKEITLILLGADKKFLADLKFDGIKPKRVFIPKDMPRGQDIYFSTKVCNSLIITASASTFGWWIGYLLNDINSKIYFCDDFNKETRYHREDFPSEWIPLKFDLKTKQITKEI